MSQFGPKADTGSLAAGDAATAWGVISNSMNGDVRAAFHAHSNWLQVSFLEREYVVVAHHDAERIVPEDRHAHCGDGAALEDTAEASIRGGDLASEESYCCYFNSSGQIAQDAPAACVCAAKLIRSTTLKRYCSFTFIWGSYIPGVFEHGVDSKGDCRERG